MKESDPEVPRRPASAALTASVTSMVIFGEELPAEKVVEEGGLRIRKRATGNSCLSISFWLAHPAGWMGRDGSLSNLYYRKSI